MIHIARYGTTAENNSWTLPEGMFSQDTEKMSVRVHDGVTPGGFEAIGVRAYDPPVPGPNELIGGDMTAGFFGEVSVEELFTGEEVASLIGLSAGVSQYNTEPWLKFALDGKILYVAKKPYRHSPSWLSIYQAGAVYGIDDVGPFPSGGPVNQLTVIKKGSHNLKVRLLTGGNTDPFTSSDGSEWNRLLYKVHASDPEGTPWVSYTNDDINIAVNNGRYNWCQETSAADNAGRATRGNFSGLTHISAYDATYGANSKYGWRPVLELIP